MVSPALSSEDACLEVRRLIDKCQRGINGCGSTVDTVLQQLPHRMLQGLQRGRNFSSCLRLSGPFFFVQQNDPFLP